MNDIEVTPTEIRNNGAFRTVVTCTAELLFMILLPMYLLRWGSIAGTTATSFGWDDRPTVIFRLCIVIITGLIYLVLELLFVRLKFHTQVGTYYLNIEWGLIFVPFALFIYSKLVFSFDGLGAVTIGVIPLFLGLPRIIGYFAFRRDQYKRNSDYAEAPNKYRYEISGYIIANAIFVRVLLLFSGWLISPSDVNFTNKWMFIEIGGKFLGKFLIVAIILVLRCWLECLLVRCKELKIYDLQVLALQDLYFVILCIIINGYFLLGHSSDIAHKWYDMLTGLLILVEMTVGILFHRRKLNM